MNMGKPGRMQNETSMLAARYTIPARTQERDSPGWQANPGSGCGQKDDAK